MISQQRLSRKFCQIFSKVTLQPWTSDAEGENWEETSQPWAGPCEGKSVQLQQLLEGLCGDVQAAVLAAAPAHPLSAFVNVKDHELQSLPPSQDYQAPSDAALLRGAFPQLMLNFSEEEAVRLLLLGLRDRDAVGCMEHGVKKDSAAAASQLNPVDAVFRMAADISRVDFIQFSKNKSKRERLCAISNWFRRFVAYAAVICICAIIIQHY